jgi:hypothetical protein
MNDRIRYSVLIVAAATLGLWVSVSLAAHHGTAIAYDIQHPITLKGTVTELMSPTTRARW